MAVVSFRKKRSSGRLKYKIAAAAVLFYVVYTLLQERVLDRTLTALKTDRKI